MLNVEYVESMIIRPCNLSCQGCTTFSDLKWTGYTTWQEGKSQIQPWLSRLKFQGWGVMGGEPLMNPDLKNWIHGIRDLMPETQIRVVTNGLLLEKNLWLVDLLHEIGNSTFKISVHVNDSVVQEQIEKIKKRFAWNPVTEFGIDRWITGNEFRFQIAEPKQFVKTFVGSYENMSPHNSLPSEAFSMCVQQRCPMIYNGLLYKCGTAGLTPDLLTRFNYPNRAQWEPFLNQGLAPDCSDQDLQKFVNNFGLPHSICRQCPSQKDTKSILNHLSTVSKK